MELLRAAIREVRRLAPVDDAVVDVPAPAH